ncbi:hypothetical protein QU38_00890, partial [Staphylococcus aureus]
GGAGRARVDGGGQVVGRRLRAGGVDGGLGGGDQSAIGGGDWEGRRAGEAQPVAARRPAVAAGERRRRRHRAARVRHRIERLRQAGEQGAELFGECRQRAIPQIEQPAELAADRGGIDPVASCRVGRGEADLDRGIG